MEFESVELSLLLTDDQEIRELNGCYRNKRRATDVLSFAPHEGPGYSDDSILGDIVISVETAAKQAKRFGVTLQREVLRLLIHGILHLAGYDHVQVPRTVAETMREKEEELFQKNKALISRR